MMRTFFGRNGSGVGVGVGVIGCMDASGLIEETSWVDKKNPVIIKLTMKNEINTMMGKGRDFTEG
jgi:hypothetical protein